MFEPFFTTKEAGRGTGLGLAMVRDFIRQSGGHVRLASAPGVGTTVELLLPELVGARADERADADPGARPRGTESILVVDDEPAVAAFARRSLADLGYGVCVEPSVTAAIDHLRRCGDIDLLLSDVVLPDGSGAEIADAVREARPGTPTLFVCGYTADALADRGVSIAGLDILAKPYDGVELATRVRRALDAGTAGPIEGPRPPPEERRPGAAGRPGISAWRTRLHSGRDAANERGQVAGDARPRQPERAGAASDFRRLPSPPRCKMCHAPFGGIGGFVLKPWFGPWEKNPQLCKACIGGLVKQGPGGAEVEISLLFADIRGSTAIGERLSPTEFSALLHAFYRIAAAAIADHEGVVDKFVGDEAIGLFIPGFAGRDHAAKAIGAGRALLAAVGRRDASASGRIPVGAGIHTGVAYVGSVGASGEISDFTALGDVVNSTARLASLAAAGELLVSTDAASHARLTADGLERRAVEVRGRGEGLEVLVMRPAG